MEQGTIFNIQKFSIHDGPGIRTTVFMKGCPLRCKWCSNPESQNENIQISYDKSKCSKCLLCIRSCMKNALNITNGIISIDYNKCVGCLSCINVCPNKSFSQEGKLLNSDEALSTCMQDFDFYEESGGGVTISGGEGMCQPKFVKELVLKLKNNNVHCAIETTGYVEKNIFIELSKCFDLLLFDLKHYDSIKHYEGTLVGNELIIENLKWSIDNNINVLVRIPVIPDFNNSLKDAYGFANLLNYVGISKVQLLPFHQFGEQKYELLNKKYLYKNKKPLYPEDLNEYKQIFLDKGIDCYI